MLFNLRIGAQPFEYTRVRYRALPQSPYIFPLQASFPLTNSHRHCCDHDHLTDCIHLFFKWTYEILQKRMFRILLAQKGLRCWNAPIYSKRIVKDTDATICLRVIKLVALILKNCRFTKNSKAMGKTLGDEKLAMIVLS